MRLNIIQEALNGAKKDKGYDLLFIEAENPKLKEKIKTSAAYKVMVQDLLDNADKYLNQPVKSLPYSLFKLFQETGSRVEYEAEYFEHRDRLNIFAILAWLDENPKYISVLEDTIWAICDEFTWCLPAHLGNSIISVDDRQLFLKEHGIIKEKILEQERMLDLFSAETAFALAEILSLLEDKLALPVVQRARREIFRRVLEPYAELSPMLWWETSPMNWAAVCAGSIGSAAMYLIDDNQILAPLLQRVLETMDYFIEGFGNDGACTEGLGYWTYGFGFYVYFAALLKQRTAGKIDLFQNKKIQQIASFQQKCYLTENFVVSFSDASLTENYQPGLTHYLKSIYQEVELPDSKYQAKLSDDRAHRWAHAIRNFVWYNPDLSGDPFQDSTFYLEDAQWLISKKRENGELICFAAKGGHNNEPHNHNDVGSFIFHVNGDNLLADLGRSQYSRQYFRNERYQFLCPSSRGHSLPIVEGQYQKAGWEYQARIIDVQMTDDKDLFVLDIAKTYDTTNLKSLLRRFTFEKSLQTRLVLIDEYQFDTTPAAITERFITLFKPEEIKDGVINVKGIKSSMEIIFNPDTLIPTIRQDSFITQENNKIDVFLIDFVTTPTSANFNLEFVFAVR